MLLELEQILHIDNLAVLNDKSVLSEASVVTWTISFIVRTMNISASKGMKQIAHSRERLSVSIHKCFYVSSSFFFVKDSVRKTRLRGDETLA
jgi:hypothetical protein